MVRLVEGFNISSCQFAFTISLKIKRLNNFLRNVSECTKVMDILSEIVMMEPLYLISCVVKHQEKVYLLLEDDKKIWQITKGIEKDI